MTLTLYYHPLSQPSRTLLIFLHLTGIKHEKKVIDLIKGEHKTPEYSKVNPLQVIPAIQDGDFCLGESEAIVKYLMNTRKVGSMYYPTHPKDRALVDKYMPFHHSTFRPKLAKYFVASLSNILPNENLNKEEIRNEFENACKTFEEVFLSKSNYIADDILTIADLFAINELTQIYFTTDYDFEKFPLIQAYIKRCLQNPVINEVNLAVKEYGESKKQKGLNKQ